MYMAAVVITVMNADDRLLGLRRQLIAHRVHLGADFGEGALESSFSAQGGRDGRRRRSNWGEGGQVLNALCLRDGRLQRLRDEPGDGGRIGTIVGGADRMMFADSVCGYCVIDRLEDGAHAQHQNEQADDDRKHGAG